MVVISEMPDENPQEDEENPQEDDENQQEDDENLQEAENLLDALQLPQDQVENLPNNDLLFPPEIIESIVALVRRCDYPALHFTSKVFHQVMTSEILYNLRLNSGLTERILYVLIGFRPPLFDLLDWYILYRNLPRNITLKLRQLSSMPRMNPGCAVVTIGHHMYVIGGCLSLDNPTEKVYLIDCRFHTCEPLPDMHVARCHAAAGVSDGKIYVIGGCVKRYADWVEVFDVQTQIWSTIPGCPVPGSLKGEFVAYVVMQKKIYVLDSECCLIYEPTQHQWRILNEMNHHWTGPACVIGHKLYTIDISRALGRLIVVYDPNDKHLRPVMGEYSLPNFIYQDSQLVNIDEKSLMIVGPVQRDDRSPYNVWCIEIALEPREGNEIWGTEVYSRALVLSSEKKTPYIELCRFVTV